MSASINFYDEQAEFDVLAGCFAWGAAKIFEAREQGLTPIDFVGDYRDIYAVIDHLAEVEQPILEISVKDELERRKIDLRKPGLLELLSEAANDFIDFSKWDYALRKLLHCRDVRDALRDSERLATEAIKSNGNLPYLKMKFASELAQKSQAMAPPEAYLFTEPADDEGNAQCVARLYAGKFLQCDALGWLFYNGRYWQREGAEGELDRAIVETLTKRRIMAVKANDEKLVKAAKPSAANVRNCKALLKSLVMSKVSEFDNNPDLLNCKNGVVDLRTGDLAAHDPGQRFTYCLATSYNPQADDSAWADWLYSAICPEDIGDGENKPYTDLLAWLQMAVGYSLTGRTNEQCLFFLQGPTRGGKGLFSHTLNLALGKPLSYAVDFDTFTAKRTGDSQNFDLAPLKAARFVIASESNRANLLNAKVVKAITGNDPVYCAFKHRDHFEYTPQFKIWLSSNFHVMGDAGDDALWGRLRVIHFPNSYLGREDFTLADKLQANLEGVLAWAVAGAKEWYKQLDEGKGLGRPELVTETTQAHRDENDNVKQFIDECCKVGATFAKNGGKYKPGQAEKVLEMYPAFYTVGKTFTYQYTEWCKENGLSALGGRRLGAAMRAKGFVYGQKKVEATNTKGWFGIKTE